MFSKKNKPTGSLLSSQKPANSAKPAVPSIISRDLVLSGDLNSDGEVQVDGKVIGDIRTKSLLIGVSANVKGEIIANSVIVHGNVDGQIKAHTVTLAKTAHVVGDILHVNLSIETGAFLEGLCKRMLETELTETSKINIVNKALDSPVPSPITANNPKNVLS
jgi:cytoskeletal protein CcmA (bactofilin family)